MVQLPSTLADEQNINKSKEHLSKIKSIESFAPYFVNINFI